MRNKHHFEIDTENLEKAWLDVQEGKFKEESWATIAPEAEAARIETQSEVHKDMIDEPEEIPELSYQTKSKTHSFVYETKNTIQRNPE